MTVAEATPSPHHWTIDEYHRLGEAGVFDEARVELIEGEILDKSSKGPLHVYTTSALNRVLAPLHERPNTILRVADPVTLEKVDSEPEPDVLVVRGALADYLAGHPGPDDVILAIEVSDTTLRFDRGRRASVYLRSGLAEYWVVDVRGREVLVHRLAGENWEIERVDATGTVTVPGTGLTLRTADFLPPPD